MNFLHHLNSKSISKGSLALLSGLIMMSISNLDAASLPKSKGPPIRVSPIPGPANPDPILQNLSAVMSNWFQKPFYPGSLPFPSNYLAGITGQYNSYTNASLAINPCNDKIILTNISQNVWGDSTGTFRPEVRGSATNGISFDGGLSWKFIPPPQQVIPLAGGTLAQNLEPLLLYYNKHGDLYGLQKFSQSVANPPNLVPMEGIYFSRSDNNGKTWTAPVIVKKTDVCGQIFVGPPYGAGLGIEGLGILPDPADADLIHVTYPSLIYPTTFYGNIFYLKSKNGGKTFSTPKQIYSMIDDPVWKAKHFDPNFTSDPNYFKFGGQTWTAAGQFVVVDEDVLLLPVYRYYPMIGATTYTQTVSDSFNDRAVIRSMDNGKTWSPIAGATQQFIFPFAHDPANGIGYSGIYIFDGAENQSNACSSYTGRVYMVWMAGNPAASPILHDPEDKQFYPHIVLSVSYDKGATWSDPIQINLTPKNISLEKQQAFQPNLVLTQDGSLVVGYYDYRNWTGVVGEDTKTHPLQTDFWLAVYKETSDPHGGSTGIGLDVVGEIRVTPHSYNARIGIYSLYQSATGGQAPLLAVNSNNELSVIFSIANESSAANIMTGFEGMTIDTNNRYNTFLRRYQFPKPSNE